MLLLLVLSVLALFMMVGAFGMLLAMRARESARAFSTAPAQAGSASLARAQLDEALLRLIRGGTAAGGITESLLADKYGSSLSGTITGVSGTPASALFTVTLSGTFRDTTTGSSVPVSTLLANPADVSGRALTFVPARNDPTGATSYRILRTGSAANTLVLANVKPTLPLPPSSVFPCEAVINGREFAGGSPNEPYDAFDDTNPFLTVYGATVAVTGSAAPPVITVSSGTVLSTGSLTIGGTVLQTGTHTVWPLLAASAPGFTQRPSFGTSGMTCTVDNDADGINDGIWMENVLPSQRTPDGRQLSFAVSYLVLDLDGRINLNAHGSFVRAQISQDLTQYPRDPATVPIGLGYGPADVDAERLVATASELSSGTVPARWQLLLQGGSVPPTANALVSSTTQWRPTPVAESSQPGRYTTGTSFSTAAPGGSTVTGTNPLNSDAWLVGNSPTDLKGRMQSFTEGSPPVLKFARPSPEWSTSDTDDVMGSGTAGHPYRLRLDDDGRRAAGPLADDAVFTAAELERILRQFDSDASALPPRLASLLDDLAERSRMTITTKSWDTPAITGPVAQMVVNSGTIGNSIYTVLGPEVVAGHRFNLNRPIVSGSSRQEYFRQLYTLMLMFTGTANAPDAAQWAANVIEFRDPDSVMTWYPYDHNALNGTWSPGTNGVWGAERPELVITSATTSIVSAQVSVTFYRPWSAQLVVSNSATASGTTERIDACLGNAAANTLDVTRRSLNNTGTSAVWRLSVGGTTQGLDQLLTSATAVTPNSTIGPAAMTPTGAATQVELQRLADPTREYEPNSTSINFNDYVAIHRESVPRPTRQVARWLHWPNRDLVSNAELLTVLSGTTASIPEAFFTEGSEVALARTQPFIFDATIVPSRFAGATVSVANASTYLPGYGLDNFMHSHFSRWRETGRINLNTIYTNLGNTPRTLDNAVWTALAGQSGLTNPAQPQIQNSGTIPYTPVGNLTSVLTAPQLDRSGADALSAFLKRSAAVRLANCATVRSHVFAVWITVRITDLSPNAGPPQYARMFAIVDRSIPVGYAPGRTLNVRDTIRLQRFMQ